MQRPIANHWSVRLSGAMLLVLVTAFSGNMQGIQRMSPAADAVTPPDPNQGLVLLTVSVAGPADRPILPIDKKRFHVFEDGVEQKIDYFWVDNRPLAVGFVFDDSDRMSVGVPPRIDALAGVIPAFFETRIPADEYFVETFNTTPAPVMVTPYTTDLKRAPKMFRYAPFPDPHPANLYDGTYLGLELIKEAANPRKILLVINGGVDSGFGIHDLHLIEFAMKQPVQVYYIYIPLSPVEFDVLPEVASVTGGLDYLIGNEPAFVEAAVREIARGVRTQYLIGFKAVHHDGKRRGVQVKVDRPDNSPKLRVWTKSGYVADKRN